MKKIEFNVGLFNESFPPLMDGVAVCVQNYAYWMQKKVGGVEVVTPRVTGADYSQYDYSVHAFLSVPVPGRRPYVAGIPEMSPYFLEHGLTTRYKIIHAHSPFLCGKTAMRMARRLGVPLVATFHSKYRDDFSRVLPKLAVGIAVDTIVDYYEQADMVWVPQASTVEVLREYGYKGHVEVMGNGSDLVADYPEKFFVEARQRLGIAPGEFVMLFVGQHIWEKNPRLIIESLARIPDVPFRMYFVGMGYAAEEMKQLVSERGLDEKVRFVGQITDRARLTDYYAASDLFLFPSLYDTAGLVVQEAAALGTPSVMAREATAASVIHDGQDGFLVDNDPDKMAELLRTLVHDPVRVRRVGVQAGKSLVRSWEDCVDEVLDRYDALLRSRGLPLIKSADNF